MFHPTTRSADHTRAEATDSHNGRLFPSPDSSRNRPSTLSARCIYLPPVEDSRAFEKDSSPCKEGCPRVGGVAIVQQPKSLILMTSLSISPFQPFG